MSIDVGLRTGAQAIGRVGADDVDVQRRTALLIVADTAAGDELDLVGLQLGKIRRRRVIDRAAGIEVDKARRRIDRVDRNVAVRRIDIDVVERARRSDCR